MREKNIAVILAEGFEEIEAITIIDILRRANLNVTVIGLKDIFVTGSHNIVVKADNILDNVIDRIFYALILPGGSKGTENLIKSPKFNEFLLNHYRNNSLLGAICAAPTVLSNQNILKDKKATSYPTFKSKIKASQYLEQDVVVDGNIVTSRGVGTAIKFALEPADSEHNY